MKAEEFEQIFDLVVNNSREVLVEKAKEYASDGDRLHNFKVAAALMGGTQEQACWGFAVKHVVSVSDMVASGKTYDMEKWDEKLGDALNYLILLRAIVAEQSVDEFHTFVDGVRFDFPESPQPRS